MKLEEFQNFVETASRDHKAFMETLDNTIKFLDLCQLLFTFHKCDCTVVSMQTMGHKITCEADAMLALHPLAMLSASSEVAETFHVAAAALAGSRTSIQEVAHDSELRSKEMSRSVRKEAISRFFDMYLSSKKEQELNNARSFLKNSFTSQSN